MLIPTAKVPDLVSKLYSIVDELEMLFPGRKFTPDGHLVGSIGEVLASHIYDLELLPASTENHDAISKMGILVQIKASQGAGVALRGEPQHLIVIHLGRSGQISEIYNGPGALAWNNCGAMQRNGQRPITFNKLRRLMNQVSDSHRLPVTQRSGHGQD